MSLKFILIFRKLINRSNFLIEFVQPFLCRSLTCTRMYIWRGSQISLHPCRFSLEYIYTPFLFLHGPCSAAKRSRPRKRPNREWERMRENESYSLSFARVNTSRAFKISYLLLLLTLNVIRRNGLPLKYVNCMRVELMRSFKNVQSVNIKTM